MRIYLVDSIDKVLKDFINGGNSPKKRSKYGNIKCEYDGKKFDSTGEMNRYMFLMQCQKDGLIVGLVCQPEYKILINDIYICKYVADFSYLIHGGIKIVEDYKSKATAKDKTYRLKKKMVEAYYGVSINEVISEPTKPLPTA